MMSDAIEIGEVVIHQKSKMAWHGHGRTAFPLNAEETKLIAEGKGEEVAQSILAMRSTGRLRCTGCSKEIAESEIASRPLFAGAVCADCSKKHGELLERERKSGNVCRMCGQPRSNCCC